MKTKTLHRIFHLRVVERAEDAMPFVVVPVPAEPPAPAPHPEPEPMPAETEPDIPESMSGPAESKSAKPEPAAAPDAGGANAAAGSSRFELSVHAVGTLVGTTEISVPGYETTLGRKSHHTFGIRVVGARCGAPWALEANLSGEWLAAPTVHTKNVGRQGYEELQVGGPWLRADGGLRMRAGDRLAATGYAAFGLQVHHRDIERFTRDDRGRSETMPFLGVLVLGMGFEHRAGNLLLGLDFQVRQGVPADYRSVTWVLSVGYVLDQGD